jgi:hypothetical protein
MHVNNQLRLGSSFFTDIVRRVLRECVARGRLSKGGARQSPKYGSLVPSKIVSMTCLIATLSAVNVMAHPLSHIHPTDKRECWAKPGNIWACMDVVGKDGRSKLTVCVDAMTAPFGRWDS